MIVNKEVTGPYVEDGDESEEKWSVRITETERKSWTLKFDSKERAEGYAATQRDNINADLLDGVAANGQTDGAT